MSSHAKRHAFTDGLSRRAEQDVTLGPDPFAIPDVDAPPLAWTPEHVGRRLIAGFETLLALNVVVGPRGHGNAWPAMLQEFADLVDAEAMQNARDAFTRARRRPSAEDISRMDEALAWPLRYGADEPMLCDAALLWSLGKAAHVSIARILRARAARAKALASNMTIAENARRQAELRVRTAGISAWAENKAYERGLRDRSGPDRAEGKARLVAAALSRHEDAARDIRPVRIAPHEAMPDKVLSRASLDRHLPTALRLLADGLAKTGVPVR